MKAMHERVLEALRSTELEIREEEGEQSTKRLSRQSLAGLKKALRVPTI